MDDQRSIGIETERSEHSDLYEYIKEQGLPDEDTFYGMIVDAHLRDDPEYYTKENESGNTPEQESTGAPPPSRMAALQRMSSE